MASISMQLAWTLTDDDTAGYRRLPFLDAARAIAATSVLVQHCGEQLSQTFRYITFSFMSLGQFGVILFFLISGYVIPLTMDRSVDLRGFWINRFFRLYPLYWSTLIAVVALAYLAPDHLSRSPFTAGLPQTLLWNVSMVQSLFREPNAVSLYWTLAVEMLFYVIYSGMWIFRQRLAADRVVNLISLLLLAQIVISLLSGHPFVKFLSIYFPPFFVGALLYRKSTKEITLQAAKTSIAIFLIAYLATIVVLTYTTSHGALSNPSLSNIAVTTGGMLAYLTFLALDQSRSIKYPSLLLYVGRISYSLYLIQGVLIMLNTANRLLHVAFIVVGMLLLAPVTYKYIELPSMRLGRRLVAKLKVTAP